MWSVLCISWTVSTHRIDRLCVTQCNHFAVARSCMQTSKRAEMIAVLESKKNERLNAREARRVATEALKQSEGGNTNVAQSTDEFWAIFARLNKGERNVHAALANAICVCHVSLLSAYAKVLKLLLTAQSA